MHICINIHNYSYAYMNIYIASGTVSFLPIILALEGSKILLLQLPCGSAGHLQVSFD